MDFTKELNVEIAPISAEYSKGQTHSQDLESLVCDDSVEGGEGGTSEGCESSSSATAGLKSDDAASDTASTNSDAYSQPAYVAGTFEGPEKTLEIVFCKNVGTSPDGLRSFDRKKLDKICSEAKCTILSRISNNYLDAYVLSESSLFVYKNKIIMKTCGTTTLLRCISSILQYADEISMELTWLGYSRKNLFFPQAQLWPHCNFNDEMQYISNHEQLQNRLNGSGFILGPVTGDHWFVYVADHETGGILGIKGTQAIPPYVSSPKLNSHMMKAEVVISHERTLNLMMFDMAPKVAKTFFEKNCPTGKDMTKKSGVADLCPGATIDEISFSPCGYSMNAILHETYYTIHVTPEPECSYVSFETNASLNNYDAMIRNVIQVFQPKKFLVTFFGDDSGIKTMKNKPTDDKVVSVPGIGPYSRTTLASSSMDAELMCYMSNYMLEPGCIAKLHDLEKLPDTLPKPLFPHGYRSNEFIRVRSSTIV